MRIKRFCFISSPGNGLSCCCYQSEVRNPSPTWSGKWNEAADPNLNPMQAVETESIGNSKVGSTKCKGWEKEEAEDHEATALTSPLNRRLVSTRGVFCLDLPTGYIPAHPPTSPTSTLRATRAHDADLLILSFYRSTLGASSRFTGIFLYPMLMHTCTAVQLYLLISSYKL